jgi:hypothetical protein
MFNCREHSVATVKNYSKILPVEVLSKLVNRSFVDASVCGLEAGVRLHYYKKNLYFEYLMPASR